MRKAPIILLSIASSLSACEDGSRDQKGTGPAANAANVTVERNDVFRDEIDTTVLTRLDTVGIRAALLGQMVDYEAPGMADAGVLEQYHESGRWTGTRLSRGPISFSGRWHVDKGELCVVADKGFVAGALRHGQLCRAVWRHRRTGALMMEDAMRQDGGLLTVSVQAIPSGVEPKLR